MIAPVSSLELRHVLDLHLSVPTVHKIGEESRFAFIAGGRFEGERLRGIVLAGGDDLIAVGADGTLRLDARAALETDDGTLIGATWSGIRRGSEEVMGRLARGEDVDPTEYYFRSTFRFTAPGGRYDWLNGIVAPATGRREPAGVFYSIFELL